MAGNPQRGLGLVGAAAVLIMAAAASANVRLYDSTFDWKLFEVDVRASQGFWVDGSSSYAGAATIRRFNTKVIENGFLKVTLLPEFGGRILSIFNKSTGHEELYQNHLGVAYERGRGIFYWNYLYVLGGIFPTFPEGEHGSTWNQPWRHRVIAQGPEAVTVEMSFRDTLDYYPSLSFHSPTSNTGIHCRALVTLRKGENKVRMDVVLTDERGNSPSFEYWTNVSFAPGSQPGKTFTPSNTELCVPIQEIRFKTDFYGYMDSWDKRISQGPYQGLWEYRNSRWLRNWADRGIAYAVRQEKDWWGVLNHDAGEGLFRLGDRRETPGIKFWSFGDKQGLSGLGSTSGTNENRPFVELWAGRTMEFFQKAPLPGKYEVHEQYLPVVGLDSVHELNGYGAVSFALEEKDGALTAKVAYSTAYPGQALEYWLEYEGIRHRVTGFESEGARPFALEHALAFATRRGGKVAAVIGKDGVEWIRCERAALDYAPKVAVRPAGLAGGGPGAGKAMRRRGGRMEWRAGSPESPRWYPMTGRRASDASR